MRTLHRIALLALSMLIPLLFLPLNSRAVALAEGRGATRPPASAQDARKPNIEKQNESAKEPAGAAARNKSNIAPKPAAPAKTPSRRGTSPRRELPTEYTISLFTNAPDADIAIDGDVMGKTGKDGKLVAKIKPGRHSVTVTHPQYRSLSRPIDVGPGLTELSFNLDEMIKPASLKDIASSSPPVAPEPPLKPAPNVDLLIKTFLESPHPDAVSVDDWKEVSSFSEKALARDSANSQLKARMLFAHGQRAYLQGEYTLALMAFNDALRTVPDLAAAHYGSGNAYMATNLAGEAVKSYQRTVQLLPGSARAQKALGDALSKAGNLKEADDSYARAKHLGYGGSDLVLALARNLMAEQRWTAALDELKPLEEKAPSSELFLASGECYEGLKNEFSAAMAFFKAADFDRNSAIAHYKLGLVLLNHREYAAAKDALERAVALDPTGKKINLIHARDRLKEISSKFRK